jgi:uncharacterized protein GlcG (DUF336 family)
MITLEKARKAVEAAQQKAAELGIAVTIAIVDEHGSIIMIARMDNALQISPQFAMAKAFTSANLGFPTSALAQYAVEKKPYFGINSLFGGEFTTIAGGVPVMSGEKRIGGVGVGGSTDVTQDEQCAQAAAMVLME